MHGPPAVSGALGRRGRTRSRVFGQVLDQLGGRRAGQPDVVVPALLDAGQQAAADQRGDVLAGSRRRYSGVPGQLPHGPSAAVEQGEADASAAPVGEKPGHSG
jgi:hypothetical protein